ncbi:MAG: hypothetical protein AAF211_20015, partial [Myxococcota bacterium]
AMETFTTAPYSRADFHLEPHPTGMHLLFPATERGRAARDAVDAALATMETDLASAQRALERVASTEAGDTLVEIDLPTTTRPDDEGRFYRLPRGTRGYVRSWPEGFEQPTSEVVTTWAEVRLVSGPLSPRRVDVNVDHLRVLDPEEAR